MGSWNLASSRWVVACTNEFERRDSGDRDCVLFRGYKLAVAGVGGWGLAVVVVVVAVLRPRGTVVAADIPGGCP
jgi:hypothetical protein